MELTTTIFNSMSRLCKISDKLLLCVSGGIDSVVMLDVLNKGPWEIAVAHCNFSLRGDESDGDEAFVRSLTEKYGIRCHVIKFDTNSYAKEHKINTQIAARELRYNYFFKLKEEFGYDKIVVAHHLDDSIETFFINLLRGTGLKGISGIKDSRNNIIRPMLGVTREQIREYAEENGISHREDSSNSHDHYLRNKIRHHIIPILTEISDSFRGTMNANIERLSEAEMFISERIESIKKDIVSEDGKTLDITTIRDDSCFSFILFRLIHPYSFSSEVISQLEKAIRSNETSKWFIGNNQRILLEKNTLKILPLKDSKGIVNSYNISDFGDWDVIEKENLIIANDSDKIEYLTIDKVGDYRNATKDMAYIDKAKIHFPLTLRVWRAGDRIFPLGMKGSKTIGDFLTDRKISLSERENIKVLTDVNGNIVWIVGMQIDNRVKITEKTNEVIKLDSKKLLF